MFEIVSYNGTTRIVHETILESTPAFFVAEVLEDLIGDIDIPDSSAEDIFSFVFGVLTSHGFSIEEVN